MLSHVAGKSPIIRVDYSPKTVIVSFIIDFMEEAISVTIYPFNSGPHEILEVCSNASEVHAYLRR
jgi:hypothetical protein